MLLRQWPCFLRQERHLSCVSLSQLPKMTAAIKRPQKHKHYYLTKKEPSALNSRCGKWKSWLHHWFIIYTSVGNHVRASCSIFKLQYFTFLMTSSETISKQTESFLHIVSHITDVQPTIIKPSVSNSFASPMSLKQPVTWLAMNTLKMQSYRSLLLPSSIHLIPLSVWFISLSISEHRPGHEVEN